MADYDLELQLWRKYRQQLLDAGERAMTAQAEADQARRAVSGLEAVIPSNLLDIGDEADDSKSDDEADEERPPKTAHKLPDDYVEHHGPRGETAVAQILREVENEGLSLDDLFSALLDRGWVTATAVDPKAATRAAVNRLRKKDNRFTLESGRFYFRPALQLGGLIRELE